MSPAYRPLRRAAALVLALGALALPGCASDDEGADAAAPGSAAASASAAAPASPGPSSSTPAEGRTISATEGEMFIELSEESLSAGTYTIEVTNTGAMPHDLVLEQDGADVAGTEVIAPGGSATLEVTLEAGDYVFYCSVGSHRANGMERPVTVGA